MTDIAAELSSLALSDADVDQLNARHRRERKEHQARVQALKKSAGSDKKRKRDVLQEIATLDAQLDQRHEREQSLFAHGQTATPDGGPADADEQADEAPAGDDSTQRISKAQKRRDRKAAAERSLQAEIAAQEELNKTGERAQENRAIEALLGARGLRLHHVQSDGECLYNAVRHELQRTAHPMAERAPSAASLRALAADYIAANYGELIAYMTHPRTGDCLTDDEFRAYCEALRSTRAWGGQLEIKALSNALRVRIEVLQAAGPATVQDEGAFGGEPLLLTYHRFMYSLGEHYNATEEAVRPSAEDAAFAEAEQ